MTNSLDRCCSEFETNCVRVTRQVVRVLFVLRLEFSKRAHDVRVPTQVCQKFDRVLNFFFCDFRVVYCSKHASDTNENAFSFIYFNRVRVAPNQVRDDDAI